ncbi:MAG: TonB-dependent receptor [Marinilabiliales bacterium]|nr:MAG: TonB-dependent receptor [Marinilabiliales bacterium]
MKNKILLIIVSLISISVFSQEYTQTLRGKITDADTYITLPGANITILGTNPLKGGTSDYDGNYVIENVPVGRHNIKVSYIGYEDVYFNEIELISGNELVLNVQMTEDISILKEVVITAKDEMGEPINSMVTLSAQRITIESTSRIAAGINDPARTVQSFAGVSSADDENNELVVRGNSPRGVLWRMEGVEIPNPNHFSNGEGGSGGGVSALSTQVLDNSDFYTGAFAPEYGNALSGVFDLRLRNGNSEKHQFALQLGVMGIQASAEGPFSKNSEASYLFNYRYATTSLLNKAGFTIGNEDIFPEWQDLSMNINIPTKKFGRFNIWGLGGISGSAGEVPSDTAQWLYRSDHFSYSENQLLGVIGITNNYIFKNNRTYMRTVLAYSHTDNGQVEDSLDYQFNKTKLIDQNYIYKNLTASTLVNHKLNSKNYLRAGLIYTNQSFNLNVHQFDWDKEVLNTELQQEGSTYRMQAYLQWKYRINQKLDLNTGVHAMYLNINNDYSIEPRIGLVFKYSEKHRFSFATGLHSRVEPISIYLAQNTLDNGQIVYPNEKLKMTRAAHIVGGYTWNFAPNFSLITELYYQHLFDVPVKVGDTTATVSALNFASGFTSDPFNNEGTGTNYGLELTLDKSFSNQYYLLFTTSLFQSKYSMPGIEERNTRYNSNYLINFLAGKEFKVGKQKQNIISANIRGMLRGGYRTIPVDIEASIAEGKDVRDYSNAYETKTPDYFRIDIGASYRKNNPNWSWIVSLNIQNVTNRANVWGEYYDVERKSVEEIYMVGLIPVLNFKVEF